MKTPLIFTTLAILFSNALYAQTNDNDYYSNNIDAAIKDAKNSSSSSQYVGERWYNRTTSRSFDFPKLMNTEMSTKAINDALDNPYGSLGANPPERLSPLLLNERKVVTNNKDSNDIDYLTETKSTLVQSDKPSVVTKELVYSTYYIEKVEYKSENFTGTSREIYSESRSRSYLTPEP
jgi:hypothetical protein